jgi:phage gp36-like protein
MSYTTDADLLTVLSERSLIQLSADDPQAELPDWTVVGEARAYADGQIDARLRQRYALPLAAVPRELKDWALALARYWLYQRRPDGGDLPEAVKASAKEALAALDAVRDAKMSLALPAAGGGEEAPAQGARLQVLGPERMFGADLLGRY